MILPLAWVIADKVRGTSKYECSVAANARSGRRDHTWLWAPSSISRAVSFSIAILAILSRLQPVNEKAANIEFSDA